MWPLCLWCLAGGVGLLLFAGSSGGNNKTELPQHIKEQLAKYAAVKKTTTAFPSVWMGSQNHLYARILFSYNSTSLKWICLGGIEKIPRFIPLWSWKSFYGGKMFCAYEGFRHGIYGGSIVSWNRHLSASLVSFQHFDSFRALGLAEMHQKNQDARRRLGCRVSSKNCNHRRRITIEDSVSVTTRDVFSQRWPTENWLSFTGKKVSVILLLYIAACVLDTLV